jgi:predicted Zn-dependent protease with MMP-like domain
MRDKNFPAPDLDQIEALAREAFSRLPQEVRNLTGDLIFFVQDFPDEDVVRDLELDSPFDILGLFSGADLAERSGAFQISSPTMIFLYRRPILEYWAEEGDSLENIVRHVLVHEIGHHLSLSDEQMEAIEETD